MRSLAGSGLAADSAPFGSARHRGRRDSDRVAEVVNRHLPGQAPCAETTRLATAPVIKKYKDVLAGADILTESTAFRVMESIRLDSGYGSQVHP